MTIFYFCRVIDMLWNCKLEWKKNETPQRTDRLQSYLWNPYEPCSLITCKVITNHTLYTVHRMPFHLGSFDQLYC